MRVLSVAGGLALVGAMLAAGGCQSSGRPTGSSARPSNDSTWLASVGYDLRAGDALVHLRASEISALHTDSITQLFLRSPRVEVIVRRDNIKLYRLHRAPAPGGAAAADTGCALEFYINGSLLRQRTGDIMWEMQPDRLLKPHELTALEIFDAAHAPVGDPGGCGAILYWVTRLRDDNDPPFTALLSGQVVRRPEGGGIAGVPVKLEPGGLTRVSDARGAFDFGALPPTLYHLEAVVPEWGTYRTDLPLRSNAAAEVEIEIDRR